MKLPALAMSGLLLACPVPCAAASYDLVIDRGTVRIDGQDRRAVTINGQIAGPTLHWKEGEAVTVNVTNRLGEETSIHWHGIQLPATMDGVPMVNFAGIKPGETFSYRFTVRQAGTYWYHSHSAGQEQEGMYAPIVIAPAAGERHRVDRDYVVMLSDSHPMPAAAILRKLKQEPGYFNDRRRTLPGLMRELSAAATPQERQAIIRDRLDWGAMRMDPTDLADVTGYTFLVNGRGPGDDWTGLFRPGEKLRLRFINGAAMTMFDVRVPGLKLAVVQADGQDVRPVEVDTFRFGPGETYDVIVEPRQDRAYTIQGVSIDRRGAARATLAPRPGMAGPMPALAAPSLLTMADMGADMGHGMAGMDHSKRGGMDHAAMGHDTSGLVLVPPPLAAPGEKVLGYGDLRRLDGRYRLPEPNRTIDVRLTGNMEKFIWSFDDRKYADAPQLAFTQGETVRLVLRNETMMNHPIHLHGLWMDLENGAGDGRPRKHTVVVPPGRTVSVTVTMSEPGRWPFHCHFLFHMATGMFREFVVAAAGTQPAAPAAPDGGHAHHH
jgi:L-ascorbate oxidase